LPVAEGGKMIAPLKRAASASLFPSTHPVRRASLVRIRHILLSPGHNYFGHHEQPPGNHPMIEVDRAECVAERGIRGDRFFDYKHDYKGQITFFSWEVFCDLRRELSALGAHPSALRRNIITEGANLAELIGTEFEVQGVRLRGVEECRPCYWMDRALAPGAEAWLKGRGGLRCRILTNGWLTRDALVATAEKTSGQRLAKTWPDHESG
jgi:MOSC domain-containing protein YiiM